MSIAIWREVYSRRHQTSMRILHLASGNRWTGAAAPAFAEVEALRLAGQDAHYAYVGGYRLEAKLRGLPHTHALIAKAQNPIAFFRSVEALAALGRFDVVHSHLTYDHVLGARLARKTGARLARTFHARRALRGDPLSGMLTRRTDFLFVINDTFTFTIAGRRAVFTPPPVDHRQFSPSGPDARARYGFDALTPVLAVIGKLAPLRGFELALESFAAIRREVGDSRLMVVGHGPHQAALEALARSLEIADSVTWAGYHEDDLAEHYRAADLLLFTEKGSDEGHRAVLEAMACGVPPVTAPVEGVGALLRGLAGAHEAPVASPGAIAEVAVPILRARDPAARTAAAAHSAAFGYEEAARRLMEHYGG